MDYTLEFKQKIIDLHENGGRSVGSLAEEYDLPYAKVLRWVSFGIGNYGARIPRRAISPEHAEAVIARAAEERNRYAHFYDNPNVELLGDPPLHRSALGKRLIEEGRL